MTRTSVAGADDRCLELAGPDQRGERIDIGAMLIIAIGPASERGGASACVEAGVPYALVGDAWQPGDFLTCLRDAGMVALSVDRRLRESALSALS